MSGKEDKNILAIVVGGGPAPGINGVISSATIEAEKNNLKVLGIYEGFKHLMTGNLKLNETYIELKTENVSRIHSLGGSYLFTSRASPKKENSTLAKTIESLEKLNVKYLITIGGDDTAYTASLIYKETKGRIKVVHVPKTIDNDLPLPSGTSTFGFQTARHVGVQLVLNIMEDAKTTRRWYFVVTMGRKAGHLAIGIGKAAGATITVIGEEFTNSLEPYLYDKIKIPIFQLADTLACSIIKRLAFGKDYGVAVLAEGLISKLDPSEFKLIKDVPVDSYGNIRYAEIDFGKFIKIATKKVLNDLGIDLIIVSKNIGYELRCANPIPFDIEYTRDLGYGAVHLAIEGNSGVLVSRQAGRIIPIHFDEIIDRKTGKIKVRYYDTTTESYKVAREYMIRLEPEDLVNKEILNKLASVTNLTPEQFLKRFAYLCNYKPSEYPMPLQKFKELQLDTIALK